MSNQHDVTDAGPKRDKTAALQRCWAAQADYIASGRSDFAPMARTLHPHIVLHQAPSLPYGGDWYGHDGLHQWLHAMDTAWTSVRIADPRITETGDTVVVWATFRAYSRNDNELVEMPICEIVRFADDLPIDWRVFYFDTADITQRLSRT